MKIRNIAAACVAAGLASTAFGTEAYVVTPLIAGQHTDIGAVSCTISTTTSECTYYVTEPGWCLTETHLYVGAELPRRAAPGQFPYQTSGGCETRVSIELGLAGVTACGSLVVMAHAVAVNRSTRQAETAWGEGLETGRGGWSMSFGFSCGAN